MCTCDTPSRRETVVGVGRMDAEEEDHDDAEAPPPTPDDVLDRKLGEQDFMDGQRLDIEASKEQLELLCVLGEISVTNLNNPQFRGQWVLRHQPPPTLSDLSDDEEVTAREC